MVMAKINIPYEVAQEYDTKDFKNMKFQDIQRVASSYMKEARKRVKELKKLEPTLGKSQALIKYLEYRENSERGGFSARYKNKEQLIKEIASAKQFLDDKTSTSEGFKNWIDEFNKQWEVDETSPEFREKYYETYRKLTEHFNNSKQMYSSDNIFEKMKEQIGNKRTSSELTPELMDEVFEHITGEK